MNFCSTVLILVVVVEVTSYRFNNTYIIEKLRNLNDELQNTTEDTYDECYTDLTTYLQKVLRLNYAGDNAWVLEMLDSSTKIPNGLLYGNLVHIGQYDECLKVKHPTGRFRGQHCMLDIHLNLSTHSDLLRIPEKTKQLGFASNTLDLFCGFCVPSTCTAEQLNRFFYQAGLVNKIVNVTATKENCWTNKTKTLNPGIWKFIGINVIILTLVFANTLYEVYITISQENAQPKPYLCFFSLLSNVKHLFKIRKSNEDISCLYGIRTFSMLWVILGHTYDLILKMPIINLSEIEFLLSPSHILISNSFYSVDTFFFMSGTLTTLAFFRSIRKKGYFDFPVSFLHRYLRLTPQLIFMILINMTVLETINEGPLWTRTTAEQKQVCVKNWWSNLVYLQNYLTPLKRCVGQSWYLACDMQMFLISPLLLYPIFLWKSYGIMFLGLFTFGSSLWTFCLAYRNNFYATINVNPVNPVQQFVQDYEVMHTRLGPWLVGIALGCLLCYMKERKVKVVLTKGAVFSGWMFSTVTCLICLYSVSWINNTSDNVSLYSALYIALGRLSWGLALAWIVFACVNGYGGFVDTFLSVGVYQPLSKLSYIVFLIHTTVLYIRIGSTRTNFYLGDLEMVYEFLGTTVLSHLLAVPLYLMIEAPVAKIDNFFLTSLAILPYPKKLKNSRT